MKHSITITGILLLIYVLAQINGFFVLDYYINIEESAVAGQTVVVEEAYQHSNITPPDVENESVSYVYVMLALLLGTGLVLLLIRYRQRSIWKCWFFLSVLVTLVISLNSWMFRFFAGLGSDFLLYSITVVGCCVLAYYKVFKHHVMLHNVTEIFIYGGLAALLVPVLNMFSVTVLLLLVGVYDMYAVWKSKHMVAMAQFQTKEKVFAGLCIPYSIQNVPDKKQKRPVRIKATVRTAVLGGGDIAFPLLFSGVVMKTLGLWWPAFIITATTTTALALLFFYGEKGKFYPAMPFIVAGCFLGYGIVLLL